MEPIRDRDAYLLRGRRVLISDLLQYRLLTAGTELIFNRPRLGVTYHATVTKEGKLLLPDGRSFASPSRAAIVTAGGSLDGWHAWQIAPGGDSLDALRQRLLDQVAELDRVSHPDHEQDLREWQSHHEFLRNARLRARDGNPIMLRVRDLLTQWNATARTQAASEQLAADLENHGLTTAPPFLKTGIDSLVAVVEQAVESEQLFASEAHDEPSSTQAGTDVGLTLGNIPSANTGVEAITPQATYEEAITRMLLNDYSQLAVMNGPRSTPRAVTWQSIARARHASPDGGLNDAIVAATTLPYDAELIDVLPILEAEDFVFVKDVANLITGIVTTADVVRAYGQLATPFFLVGELDRLLRRLITDNFTIDDVRVDCDSDGARNLQSYDELTMGDYQRVLQDPAHWATLGWPLDRATFTARLDTLRELRNDLVHFNPDPLPDQMVAQLRHMIQLVRKYAA